MATRDVHIHLTKPGPTGTLVPKARMVLQWTPTARRVDGDAVVLPSAFPVVLDTNGEATVAVEVTAATWCWEVREQGDDGITRYVAVTAGETTAEYVDLVDVDPDTLDPAAEPEAAWWAEIATQISGGAVVGDDLVLTRRDGSTINAGDVRGPAGTPIEVQVSATHIQWRYVGAAEWTDLIAVAELEGDPGLSVELQTTATHVQWRQTGGAWSDLVALADITGADGYIASRATLDTEVTALDANPASALRVQQDARHLGTYVARAALRPGQSLSAALDLGVACDMVVLGDSTGNDWFEWPKRFATALAADHPALTVRYRLWSSASEAYGAMETIQTGATPPSDVETTTVEDQFGRTAADLVGSTPDVGGTWQGTTERFSVNGSQMVVDAAGLAHTYPSEAPTGATATTVTATLTMDRAGAATVRTMEIGAKAVSTATHVFVSMSVPTGNGLTWSLWKRIGSVATKLADGTTNSGTTVMTHDVSLTVDGADVSATLGGETITGTLTESDVTALASGWGVTIWAKNADVVSTTVDSITATAVTGEDLGHTVTIHNGSIAGSTLAYQQSRIADMVPEESGVVVLSSSHNYALTTPADYLTAVRDFVTDLLAARPDIEVLASSQNPQFSPRTAAQIAAHVARLAALRVEASRQGWGYLPIVERWTTLVDGGRDWVQADGIHPTYDATGEYDGGTLWASVVTDYVAGLSLVP